MPSGAGEHRRAGRRVDAFRRGGVVKHVVTSALWRIIPVGLALTPIGVLFGVLAAQLNWTPFEVFLMSLIGFTGSGQFAYLGFASRGIDISSLGLAFLVILSMNLRYVPMSLTATAPLKINLLGKVPLAHWLADESYATETQSDGVASRFVIRGTITAFWCLSTAAGVALAAFLPPVVKSTLAGVTYPVSAILLALGLLNIYAFVRARRAERARQPAALSARKAIAIGFVAVFVLQYLLGPVYFWIPGIAVVYWLLVKTNGRIGHE
ncbi:branched-chain amino acid ABC transporter permease [Burkholderia sp. Bp9002]|nr:branched-chain amino acid ABC transporter permease [Burkholderia sp. Bp9125]RQS04409.1 branched-chain amino acid ABC transporter permease [Burkholderia sp. Bp9002]